MRQQFLPNYMILTYLSGTLSKPLSTSQILSKIQNSLSLTKYITPNATQIETHHPECQIHHLRYQIHHPKYQNPLPNPKYKMHHSKYQIHDHAKYHSCMLQDGTPGEPSLDPPGL